jgi:hypothetical protein
MTLSFYRYSVLRFVPGIARGEAANLGVIVVDDATGEAASAFLPDFGPKISALAPGFSVAGFTASVERFRRQFGERRNGSDDHQIRSSARLAVLSGAMRNQLQLSGPKPFRAASLSEAARQLYDELVRPVGATSHAEEIDTTTT